MEMDKHTGVKKAAVFLILAAVVILSLAVEAAKEKVVVTSDERVTIDLDADITIFDGNVRISYSDVTITADRAEVKGRKVATITGHVRLTQPDITLIGDLFTAHIAEKRVIVEGNVVLSKEEEMADAGSKDGGKKELVAVTCDKMELSTSTRGFVAEGNVTMKRGGNRARADRATYAEKDRLAVLEGNVEAEGKNREVIRCGRLLFRTDRDYMEAEDKVILEFEVEEEETEGEEEGGKK